MVKIEYNGNIYELTAVRFGDSFECTDVNDPTNIRVLHMSTILDYCRSVESDH